MPPIVHNDVQGDEQAFEIHARPPFVFRLDFRAAWGPGGTPAIVTMAMLARLGQDGRRWEHRTGARNATRG